VPFAQGLWGHEEGLGGEVAAHKLNSLHTVQVSTVPLKCKLSNGSQQWVVSRVATNIGSSQFWMPGIWSRSSWRVRVELVSQGAG